MKKIIYTLLSAACMLAMGCQKDGNPYITKDEARKIDSLVHPAIKGVAFIYNSNVYYVADFTKPVTQITTDGSAASFVKISHDHTKFAYLNGSNQIMVVNNKGAAITTLSQYNQVKSFDWSADDKTLYILNGNDMVYYGPPMNLPGFSFGSFNGDEQEVISASVSMKGDLAYVVSDFDFYVGTKYEMIILPANKGKMIEYPPSEPDGTTMDYVNFSANNQDLVLGYGSSYGGGPQQKVELFTDLNSYSTGNYSGGNSATPVYNSTLNYLVVGNVNSNSTTSPAAIYLGDTPIYTSANVAQTIILDKYSIPGGVLYIDWK